MTAQLKVLLAGFLLLLAIAAQARTFVIGQVAELSGIANANENFSGARIWLDHVNARGSHKFEVKSMDDKRDPKLTMELTRKVVQEDKAIALFGYRSTPNLRAIAPLLTELQVPLVGPFNGSDAVRREGADWMFFLRATYKDEMEKLVSYLKTVGVNKVAIVHQQDPFGNEASKAYTSTLEAAGMKPMAIYSYDRKTLDTTDATRGLIEVEPRAVLMACTAKACASIIRKIRETNEKMLFLILSNAVNDELLRAIADVGRNVIMSQVMPYPWNNNLPIVKEFSRLNSLSKDKAPISHAALEGFAAAKLLTTATLKSGPKADARRIAEFLRNTKPIDLGGIYYDPLAKSRYVELTMVSRDGRLIK